MNPTNYLKINVSGFDRIGLSYVVFIIKIETDFSEYEGRHYTVKRRYSEFEWLYRRLTQSYPALFIPPLPGKEVVTTLDRFGEGFLKTRSNGLQLFLTRIARHPMLPLLANVLAFLQLSRQNFLSHMDSNPILGRLTELFSSVSINSLSNLIGPQSIIDKTQNTTGLIGSSTLKEYQNEFLEHLEDTQNFILFTQRIERATLRIVTDLTTLGDSYEELTNCLKVWSPSLIVQSANGEQEFHKSTDLPTDPKQTSSLCLNWNKERPYMTQLIALGTKVACTETKRAAKQLDKYVLPNWKDAGKYAKSIKNVLESRNNLEENYFEIVQQIKSQTIDENDGQQPNSNTKLNFMDSAKSFLPWRQKSVTELIPNANYLQDELIQRNEQIRADFGRWQTERSQDALGTLLKMARIYFKQWTNISSNWNEVIKELDNHLRSNESVYSNAEHSLSSVQPDDDHMSPQKCPSNTDNDQDDRDNDSLPL